MRISGRTNGMFQDVSAGAVHMHAYGGVQDAPPSTAVQPRTHEFRDVGPTAQHRRSGVRGIRTVPTVRLDCHGV